MPEKKEGTRYNKWKVRKTKEAGLMIMAQKAGKVKLLEEKSGRHLKFREYEM